MKEYLAVILLSCVIWTAPLQIIGFITPCWLCGSLEENPTTIGLFYFCNNEGCQGKVLDSSVFWLCFTSACTTCFTTMSLVYIFYKELLVKAEIQWTFAKNKESILFAVFLIGQYLAGVAAVLLYLWYKEMGWSALLFTTLAIPVSVLTTAALALLLCLAYLACVFHDALKH